MAENHVLLETIELTQTAASVTFDNIPQTGYTDLKIVWSGRLSDASTATYCKLTFNGSASNFTAKRLAGSGSAVSSGNLPQWSGTAPGANATSNTFSNVEFYIPNYTSSNYKSYSLDTVTENNATEAYAELGAGLWSDTAAITSITLTGNAGSFVANSTFSLYGVAALGTTPVTAPKATGGNIVANDGTYWYHAFLSSGTFTPQTSLTCDALVIAGGGGGGSWYAGGGGAGGLRAITSQSVTSTNYTVTVGAGGSGGIQSTSTAGTNGSDSSVFSTTSTGGGTGGYYVGGIYVNPTNGGSGGGTGNGGTMATGISGQGNNGGTGYGGSGLNSAGGGGGAGAVGGNANLGNAGDGGAGVNSYSSWASVTSTGVSGYYAGGGGGGTEDTSSTGAGGAGGGGQGGWNGNATGATSAVRNTGSGGGGGSGVTTGAIGGNGGSGIVIIRYSMA